MGSGFKSGNVAKTVVLRPLASKVEVSSLLLDYEVLNGNVRLTFMRFILGHLRDCKINGVCTSCCPALGGTRMTSFCSEIKFSLSSRGRSKTGTCMRYLSDGCRVRSCCGVGVG